jgi:hypothetical protein
VKLLNSVSVPKRSRLVLFPAGNAPHPLANANVNNSSNQVSATAQEEDEYLQRFLKLADIALRTSPSKGTKTA